MVLINGNFSGTGSNFTMRYSVQTLQTRSLRQCTQKYQLHGAVVFACSDSTQGQTHVCVHAQVRQSLHQVLSAHSCQLSTNSITIIQGPARNTHATCVQNRGSEPTAYISRRLSRPVQDSAGSHPLTWAGSASKFSMYVCDAWYVLALNDPKNGSKQHHKG